MKNFDIFMSFRYIWKFFFYEFSFHLISTGFSTGYQQNFQENVDKWKFRKSSC